MCPNWCECSLRVIGNRKDIIRFIDHAKSRELEDGEFPELDANRFIPYPLEFKIQDLKYKKMPTKQQFHAKDGYNSGGYDWCNANWGTKWGFCHSRIYKTKTSVWYGFETAWSPPCPLILKMSEMFPKLNFTLRYYEQGAGFKGVFVCIAGVVIKNDYHQNYHGGRGG